MVFGSLRASSHDHDEIQQGAICVGQVTAAAWSALQECGIGYVRFSAHADGVGKTLQLKTRCSECVPCEVVSLPFYDCEKHIPRGIDQTIPARPG